MNGKKNRDNYLNYIAHKNKISINNIYRSNLDTQFAMHKALRNEKQSLCV